MKRLMRLYESCRTPIRVAYFGFVLVAIGFLIQNKNVNLFYTFKSSAILFIGELFLKIGEFIITNLPLVFLLNGVCKRANNASPVVMALVGYFTYLATTMLIAPQNLSPQAYTNSFGILSSFNLSTGTRLPLETGLIGSLLVAIATRISFIFSRHRGNYSITYAFSQDIAGIIYNVFFCFLAGLFASYVFPFAYNYLQKGISFIGADLSDPFRIAIYSVLDRCLSILGLGKTIRYPFWYTNVGGSLQNASTGQSILGDINIWKYAKDNITSYVGAGRFITPYYVINMFMIPGFYLGTIFSISDKKDRYALILTFVGASLLSIIAGNPLPIEYMMLLTSPIVLIFYFGLIALVSYLFINRGVFLGFECNAGSIEIAMPGTFPDFIVNARNTNLSSTLLTIAIIGLITLLLMFLFVRMYYRFFAFDFTNSGKGDQTIRKTIESVGGRENIIKAEAGLLKLNINLRNSEAISFEKVQEVGPRRIAETRDGISFEFGTSSYAIARRINKAIRTRKVRK